MIRKQFTGYVTPAIEWNVPLDGDIVLCQSPQGGLTDITVSGEEDEDDGWLN